MSYTPSPDLDDGADPFGFWGRGYYSAKKDAQAKNTWASFFAARSEDNGWWQSNKNPHNQDIMQKATSHAREPTLSLPDRWKLPQRVTSFCSSRCTFRTLPKKLFLEAPGTAAEHFSEGVWYQLADEFEQYHDEGIREQVEGHFREINVKVAEIIDYTAGM